MDIKTVDTVVLQQWLANAFVTASKALGHGKTASNEMLVRRYQQELADRGKPTVKLGLFDGDDEYKQQLYLQGVFNGPGSQ